MVGYKNSMNRITMIQFERHLNDTLPKVGNTGGGAHLRRVAYEQFKELYKLWEEEEIEKRRKLI